MVNEACRAFSSPAPCILRRAPRHCHRHRRRDDAGELQVAPRSSSCTCASGTDRLCISGGPLPGPSSFRCQLARPDGSRTRCSDAPLDLQAPDLQRVHRRARPCAARTACASAVIPAGIHGGLPIDDAVGRHHRPPRQQLHLERAIDAHLAPGARLIAVHQETLEVMLGHGHRDEQRGDEPQRRSARACTSVAPAASQVRHPGHSRPATAA